MIDTHCHLTFDDYSGTLDKVLERSAAAGVTAWLTVGTTQADSEAAVELARRYENMYAAVGVHPHDAEDVTEQTINRLGSLAQESKVVAVGETGLDFHYNYSPQDVQRSVFARHIRLAEQLGLPLIVHSREAFEQTVEILEGSELPAERVVFHCFSGSPRQSRLLAERGFYVSFTGVVTFKNAEEIRAAAKIVPDQRIMLETDCPFMSPAPMRNQRPNEPALMVHTAAKLAEIRGTEIADFEFQTTQNAQTFFKLAAE